MSDRIFLSPPFVGDEERDFVARAFDSNYIAPCGPQVDEFEQRLAALSGRQHAVAVSSGTAALDLLMDYFGVDSSWTVFAPSLTFIATVGPAFHRGARLEFVDSDPTGNINCDLLDRALARCGTEKRMVISVDLYGRCADYARLKSIAARHRAVFISDSAEAVGAKSPSGPAGIAGEAAIYSFNGNKIVTTSGGGAVLADDPDLAAAVKARSQQAREPVLWYEHKRVGYNYRLSNLLAALGLAQLDRLPAILEKRAATSWHYRDLGLDFLPPVEGENHWFNVMLCPDSASRDRLIERFGAADIEVRPVWKPLHLQPVFQSVKMHGGQVAADLFARGLCLPSGTGLSAHDLERISAILRDSAEGCAKLA
jgi:dTDP-4-amino-4,6-dideoxygalactose transaminase